MATNPETPWIAEQQQRPAVDQPVIVYILRKARLVDDGNGGTTWALAHPEKPIELERDVVFWMPDESSS